MSRLGRMATALCLLAFAAPAGAFELLRVRNDPCARGDQNLFWEGASASVSTVNLPSSLRGLADDARARWNLSVRRFRFQGSSTGIGRDVCRRDGLTSMVLADSTCDGSGFGDALAVTRSVWSGDGTLVDADVVFNQNSRIVGDEAAFREVAMHELGHVLGLDHSNACGASGSGTLMKSTLIFSAPRLEAPQADDVTGAETIYPSSTGGGTATETGSCAIVPAAALRPLLLPWMYVPLFVLVRLLAWAFFSLRLTTAPKSIREVP